MVEKDLQVPPGTPKWITPELLADTLRVWQPYYKEKLTPADAVEIMASTGQLLSVLTEPCKGDRNKG